MHASPLRLALILAALISSRSAAQPSHVEVHEAFQKGPVANAAIDERLEATAVQFASRGDIPRVALFDMAFPADSAEYERMHGYALVVITAVARDSAELPLGRAYVAGAARPETLTVVARILSRVSDAAIGGAFGTYREDVVLLMPMRARVPGAALLVDFAAHRSAFRITVFDDDLPPLLESFQQLSAPAGVPPRAEVDTLLEREYPDLAAAVVGRP